MGRFELEATDLADLTRHLGAAVGESVVGPVVGRTRFRDEVVRHLGCSLLEGEQVVDTMIGRGFIVLEESQDGLQYWTLRSP
jgi:hypothetical protein